MQLHIICFIYMYILSSSYCYLHSRLAMPRKIAEEIVGPLHQLDLIFPCLVHLGTSRRGAPIVPGLVHRHHIVSRRAIFEHCIINT